MKIALVQDWFVVNGGAEKVVKEILDLYPDADIFSLVDFFNDQDRKDILKGKHSRTSYIQKLPFAKKYYRYYLPFFPNAIERLDFTGYDLIISSSYAVAKGIRKKNNQIHICYCHSPVRYAWDLKKDYLSSIPWLARQLSKPVLNYIRRWDLSTTPGVDKFIANSKYIADRIKRTYGRESEVIYPAVDIESFLPELNKDDYYFTTMRIVPYKKLSLIIDAFNEMPDKQLIVAGDGPGLVKIKENSRGNIKFVGFVNKPDLIHYMQKAKAFLLAADEDFGITSLEAQSCCTPVIAFRKGGYLETVIEGKTGIFFDEQNSASLIKAIMEFENHPISFRKEDFLNNVSQFSSKIFKAAFKKSVTDYVERANQ